MPSDSGWSYQKEEWTAISDIGKSFDNKVLSVEDYIETEDKYIKAIKLIMDYNKLGYIYVHNAQKSFSQEMFSEIINKRKVIYTTEIINIYNNAECIEKLDSKDIDMFFKLLLREDIGAKILYPRRLKIFVSYDFLMGVNCSRSLEIIIPDIEALGLYVEEFGND